MTDEPKKLGLTRSATVFFVACMVLLLVFLYLIFRPFFSILIWACVLSVVFHPLFRLILRIFRGRRTAAALVTCLLILLLIVLPVTFLGILLGQQTVALYHSIQSSVGAMSGEAAAKLEALRQRPWVGWALDRVTEGLGSQRLDLRGTLQQILGAVSRFVVSGVPSVLAGVGGILYGFLMMFISMFFLFRDGPVLLEFVQASNPLPDVYESEIIKKFQDVSYATFYGSLLTAIVQGIAGGLLFWVLGIASPLFWGAVIAFVALVPIVGAFLVWLPVSSYLLLIGQTTRGILLLVIGALVVSSIDNVLKPLIIQERTDMHPLLVFLSVLGGMNAFGFLGILLGPLIVAVFLSFLNFYKAEFREVLQEKLAARHLSSRQ